MMLRADIPPTDSPSLRDMLRGFSISFPDGRVLSCGDDVTEAIRTPEIDREVSPYSAIPVVRDSLLDIQRNQARDGLVAEGRDMGTVVFPDADLKIFLTASPAARAKRRYDERIAKGEAADYEDILAAVGRRDKIDSTRDVAPLKPAPNAIIFDTTDFTFDQVVGKILEYAAKL